MGVAVTKAVHEGLEAARESGEFNMFEKGSVISWCMRNGYFATAVWVQDNPRAYNRLLMEGPVIVENDE